MSQPILSVIMITYAHENYIEQAIHGVLMQKSNFEIELIIANDCSPDNTDYVILNILKTHNNASKIRYIKHEKNTGMMPNFVFAMQQAQGKYIALCEGDDYWTDPLKLQKQVDFLEANPDCSGCFHNTQVIYENSPNETHLYRKELKEIYTAEDTLSAYSLFHTSSFVFKREALFFPDWFNQVVSGDMSLFSIISKSGKLGRVDGVMSVYRKNDGGVTNLEMHNKNFYRNRLIMLVCFNSLHTYKFSHKLHQTFDQLIEENTANQLRIFKNEIKASNQFLANEISLKKLISSILKKLTKRFHL